MFFRSRSPEKSGDSSTVEQRTLTPLILVRIQVPQPRILPKVPRIFGFGNCWNSHGIFRGLVFWRSRRLQPETKNALGSRPDGRSRWHRDGSLVHKEDVAYGLENAPKALLRLFSGENFGKQLVKVADPAA